MSKQELIDIPAVLKSKSPTLYRWLPRFVIRYIERIVHVRDVNDVLSAYGHLDGAEFIDACFKDWNVSYTVHRSELLPKADGKKYVFVSNHPLGGLDGMVLISAISRYFNGNVKFVVNDLLLNLKPLESVFIPVNKHGRQSAGYANLIDEAFASDVQLLYFPAGLCSRKRKGKIVDLDWKKSVVTKAVKYERAIVPIYFSGRNSNFFYNLANIRRGLGLKANVEMFYLADELFRQRGAHFDLVVGEPIPYSTFDKSKSHSEWATYLKNKVYSLAILLEK